MNARSLPKQEITCRGIDEIREVILEAKELGWTRVQVNAQKALTRAAWFEGEMRGVKVENYTPTQLDTELLGKMRQAPTLPATVLASTVVADYERRVVPEMKRRIEREERVLFASQERPVQIREALASQLSSTREGLSFALEQSERFRNLGGTRVAVTPVYSDGTVRYDLEKLRKREQGRER